MWFFKPNVKKLKAKRNIKGLIKALNHDDWHASEAAATALGQIGDVQAVEPLIAVLRHGGERYVRAAAAKALRQLGNARAAAAEALGQLGDARAVEPLIACLRDQDSIMREKAVKALEQLGWQPGKDEAAARYWIVKEAWDKCVEIGTPAVEPLIAALRHGDSAVRAGAAKALVHLYHMGNLHEPTKLKILAQRETMLKPHTDHHYSCGFRHEDSGIGVTF